MTDSEHPCTIVFVAHTGQVSGAEKVMLDLIDVALERGHPVRVVSPDGPLAGRLPAQVDHVPIPPLGRLRLGLNIDHVATIRNARGGKHPDPLRAAQMAVAAGADGITAREKNFSLVDAYSADEAFLTGTFGAQTPVGVIDGRTIGTGRMGPVTARIRDLYTQLVGA